MGYENGWHEWVVGEDPGSSLGSRFVQNYFRYMVSGDPKFNILTVDVDTALQQSKARSAADLDASNADLSGFASRGGKLILYHGWNDAAISPWNTIAYYKNVQEKMGAQKADSFVRLYMIPGMEHCAGGPGASSFGQFGLETAKGPKYGLFDSLESWVAKGTPADDVAATKYAPGADGVTKAVMTRPLCAFPSVARYKGSGDPSNAANFECAKP
jgi:feruloyl esterase